MAIHPLPVGFALGVLSWLAAIKLADRGPLLPVVIGRPYLAHQIVPPPPQPRQGLIGQPPALDAQGPSIKGGIAAVGAYAGQDRGHTAFSFSGEISRIIS